MQRCPSDDVEGYGPRRNACSASAGVSAAATVWKKLRSSRISHHHGGRASTGSSALGVLPTIWIMWAPIAPAEVPIPSLGVVPTGSFDTSEQLPRRGMKRVALPEGSCSAPKKSASLTPKTYCVLKGT